MSDYINIVTPPRSYVELAFAWTPAGTFSYTSPGGLTLTAPSAVHNTVLTFTATAIVDDQGHDISGPLTLIEYRWDFGDGVIGYGNPVTHTYKIANFNAQTALRVTDSKGRHWYTRAQMYLT